MSSDDLTQDLEKKAATKPTIETVLERINQLGESLTLRMNEIAAKVDELQSEVVQLRNDMQQGFRKVERKIEVMNDTLLTVQADHKDLLSRVESLERKAS